jgi:type III pantothenate kinase
MVISLVLDIGNTRCKAAVFNGDTLLEKRRFDPDDMDALIILVETYRPSLSMMSSVGVDAKVFQKYLEAQTRCLELTSSLPVPFRNLYATPQTLGMDRVAAVAAAKHLFPDRHCLVIDMGTCITYDFVTAQHDYLGGSISPGLRMRLQAMAYFTKRLPEIEPEVPDTFIGDSTRNSMLSGMYYGVLGEINELVERYEKQFGDLQVILCGGDSGMFDKHTKKSIFAAPDLVLDGLNQLLHYNVK